MLIETYIEKLLIYGKLKGFYKEIDTRYVRNRVLEILELDNYTPSEGEIYVNESIEEILDQILKWAYKRGVLKENTPLYSDLLDSKIMGALMGRPSEVVEKFNLFYTLSPKKATDYFYNLSVDSNYIRKTRTDKNIHWKHLSPYGEIEITINVSKPEKDIKEIEAERNTPKSHYPRCLLCPENEGYMGRLNHPARQNLRLIPVKLAEENWFLQYSPYLYYNEHCILLNENHAPMNIDGGTIVKMFDFLDFLPHYFVGSNADLPIVGGSILSHDHFQGGRYNFPMENAKELKNFAIKNNGEIKASIIKWPLSVIRLKSKNRDSLEEIGEEVIAAWRNYEDRENEIIPKTRFEPHNTVTPIARFKDGTYELDLVLRNNRQSEKYPHGIFHPHKEVHHVKKENIGLIEVMGLAVLPARLLKEIDVMKKYLLGEELSGAEQEKLSIHRDFCDQLLIQDITQENVTKIIRRGIGERFALALKHAGVFKEDKKGRQGFLKFINKLGWREL